MKLSELNSAVVQAIVSKIESERTKPPVVSNAAGVNAKRTTSYGPELVFEPNTSSHPFDVTMIVQLKDGLTVTPPVLTPKKQTESADGAAKLPTSPLMTAVNSSPKIPESPAPP